VSNELRSLLARVEENDAATAKELQRHFEALTSRRQFGLNFERHVPEQVALVGRAISVGDKVRCIPSRGETTPVPNATWIVTKISGADGIRTAELFDPKTKGESSRPIDDLVFVADFRDPVYPGLVSSGRVERGGDKPFHALIKSENYHALEALLYAYQGKVDCVYIDPPYNTRANDWKYNNDYVDPGDNYAHSMWLAFMERRLKMAKKLLNPDDSVLIVTIDENEVHRLGLLLDQMFPSHRLQMISTVINPKGASLGRDFARVDEYIFVVYLGNSGVLAEVRDMLDESKNAAASTSVKWSSLIRGGAQGIRTDSPGAYYPVFVDVENKRIHSFGEPLPWDKGREDVPTPEGTTAVWPPTHTSGVEGRWGIGPDKARELYALGALRLGKIDVSQNKFPLSYLSSGIMTKVATGEILTVGRKEDGTLIVLYPDQTKITQPKTVWKMPGHNAGEYGSKLVNLLLPGRKFPFPKALYAVEDILRFFVGNKPNALIIDFFAGSGTTTHAVMRLNRQDDGRRRSICVTNNEVSATEQAALVAQQKRPGDPEWEALGIFDNITKPRVAAAATGMTPQDEPVQGEYKFVDEFPMADGFEENVEFFTLTYENPAVVELDMAFERIAPLLWMRAGSEGRRIESPTETFDVADTYAVLFNVDASREFLAATEKADSLRVAFVVTDDETQFQAVATQLSAGIESVRLYESYLRTFEINTGRV
jgi:adenine-specific DNA-methyltransferase